MRTVLINDGDTLQIDLVPESDHEKAVLATIPEGATLRVGKASGYANCRGGYMRQFAHDHARKFTFLTTAESKE